MSQKSILKSHEGMKLHCSSPGLAHFNAHDWFLGIRREPTRSRKIEKRNQFCATVLYCLDSIFNTPNQVYNRVFNDKKIHILPS